MPIETPRTMTPGKAAQYSGIGRTKLLQLVRAGRIETKDLDGRMRIVVASLDAFLENLPEYEIPEQPEQLTARGA
jgi:excisionase family DNA binding protein